MWIKSHSNKLERKFQILESIFSENGAKATARAPLEPITGRDVAILVSARRVTSSSSSWEFYGLSHFWIMLVCSFYLFSSPYFPMQVAKRNFSLTGTKALLSVMCPICRHLTRRRILWRGRGKDWISKYKKKWDLTFLALGFWIDVTGVRFMYSVSVQTIEIENKLQFRNKKCIFPLQWPLWVWFLNVFCSIFRRVSLAHMAHLISQFLITALWMKVHKFLLKKIWNLTKKNPLFSFPARHGKYFLGKRNGLAQLGSPLAWVRNMSSQSESQFELRLCIKGQLSLKLCAVSLFHFHPNSQVSHFLHRSSELFLNSGLAENFVSV